MQKIVIVDYGSGNLFSVYNRISSNNISPIISSSIADIENADKIVLPGVGNFAKAVDTLNTHNLIDVLHKNVLVKRKPILGICLGMQLMCNTSEEGNINIKGLGWIDANIERLPNDSRATYKVPHIGWNEVTQLKETVLMNNIETNSRFYFVHSYYANCFNHTNIVCTTNFNISFTSVIEKDNIFGVQFHPEKSYAVGNALLQNFINL
jgi:imidazole glycerol-phosphate synthase subunit HisH